MKRNNYRVNIKQQLATKCRNMKQNNTRDDIKQYQLKRNDGKLNVKRNNHRDNIKQQINI